MPQSEERLAQMRATRIRLWKAKREAEGKEYIPKAERSARKAARLLDRTVEPVVVEPVQLSVPSPGKHKLKEMKIGRPREGVIKTRVRDESKLVSLNIPSLRMVVKYDPLVRTEQEVLDKYLKLKV